MLLLIVDLMIAGSLVFIALLIFLRNTQATSNRLYFGMTMFTACWIMSNYLSNDITISNTTALWANKLVLLFPSLTLLAFLGFVLQFASSEKTKQRYIPILCILGFCCFLALTPWVAAGIRRQGDVYAIDFGILSPLYFVGLLATAFISFTILILAIKRSYGIERQKRFIIFWSLLLTVGCNVFTNIGLPLLHGSFLLTNIGPLGAIFIVLGSAYAIVKHQLFDIRTFAVRSMVYLTSLAFITCLVFVPVVLLIGVIVGIPFTWPTFMLRLFSAIVLAVLYGLLKTRFDKITNRFFMRGYYDTQTVLNQLSDALVRRAGVAELITASAKILREPLKTRIFDYHLVSETSPDEVVALRQYFKGHAGEKVLAVADDPTGASGSFAMIVRLRTTQGDLGFITLGYKESGGSYTETDRRLLSIAADEIAISLQNALHLEEIQEFNNTLQAKVNEATQELRQSNSKLQGLDQTKDEFITMASHQLRTPLTSVKGYLSMVLEGDVGPLNAQQKQLLTQSYVSAQRMVYLISDLLNLSRLNTGKFIIEPTPVDLREVIHSEMDQLRETALSREVNLEFKPPEPFPKILLDETKIHQVVMNLIDNAIYYTPPGGSIRVDLRETAHAVEFRVIDTGIGVPKAEQRKLFSKFYRAQNAQAARPDGTGIGLFMAKKVVVAQGGALIFESEEGKGSTFGFRFNKRDHLAPTPAVEA